MSKLNDYKMAELAAITGKPVGTFNMVDMEMDWLSRVRGRAGNTLNELWKQEFFAVTAGAAKLTMAYDDSAMLYLKTLGLIGETLPELWLDFWNGNAPVGINASSTLTVGQSSNQRGYVRDNYGSMVPDLLGNGDEIRRLTVRNSNGAVRFQVEGDWAQNAFITFEIIGAGSVLLSANAEYSQTPTETHWKWTGTDLSLTTGNVYLVEAKS
jgi:hypothetical protein